MSGFDNLFRPENHKALENLRKEHKKTLEIINMTDKILNRDAPVGLFKETYEHAIIIYQMRNWTKGRKPYLDRSQGEKTAEEREADQAWIRGINKVAKAHLVDLYSTRMPLLSDHPLFEQAQKHAMAGKYEQAQKCLDQLKEEIARKEANIGTGVHLSEHGILTFEELRNGEVNKKTINCNDIKGVENTLIVYNGQIYNGHIITIKDEEVQDIIDARIDYQARSIDADGLPTFMEDSLTYKQIEYRERKNAKRDAYIYKEYLQSTKEELDTTRSRLRAAQITLSNKEAERDRHQVELEGINGKMADLQTYRTAHPGSGEAIIAEAAEAGLQVKADSLNGEIGRINTEIGDATSGLTLIKNDLQTDDINAQIAYDNACVRSNATNAENQIVVLNDSLQVGLFQRADGFYDGVRINMDQIDFDKSQKDAANGDKFILHFKDGNNLSLSDVEIDKTVRDSARELQKVFSDHNSTQLQELTEVLKKGNARDIKLAFLKARNSDRALASIKKNIVETPAPRGDEYKAHEKFFLQKLRTLSSHEIIALSKINLVGIMDDLNQLSREYSQSLKELAGSALGKDTTRKTAYHGMTKIARYEHPLRESNNKFITDDYQIQALAGQFLEVQIDVAGVQTPLTDHLMTRLDASQDTRNMLIQRSAIEAGSKHDHEPSHRLAAMSKAIQHYGIQPAQAEHIAHTIEAEIKTNIENLLASRADYIIAGKVINCTTEKFLLDTNSQKNPREIARSIVEARFKNAHYALLDPAHSHYNATLFDVASQHINNPENATLLASQVSANLTGGVQQIHDYVNNMNPNDQRALQEIAAREIIKRAAEARVKHVKYGSDSNNSQSAMAEAIHQCIHPFPELGGRTSLDTSRDLSELMDDHTTNNVLSEAKHLDNWLFREPGSTYEIGNKLNNLWKNRLALEQINEKALDPAHLADPANFRTLIADLKPVHEDILDNPASDLSDGEKTVSRAAIQFQNQWIVNVKDAYGRYEKDPASPETQAEFRIVAENSLLQVTKVERDQSIALDALKDDGKTIDQRKHVLGRMLVELGKAETTEIKLDKEMQDKIDAIYKGLDDNAKAAYGHKSKDSAVNIGKMIKSASTAAADLAPLVIEHRINTLLKEGRKDEAEVLISRRFTEEATFRTEFNTFYENEMKRYQDMEKVKLSHQAAMKQLRMFVLMYAIANANQAANNLNDSFGRLTQRAFSISTSAGPK